MQAEIEPTFQSNATNKAAELLTKMNDIPQVPVQWIK